MQKVTVHRKTWDRGREGVSDVYLLSPATEKKCCLGFYMIQVHGCTEGQVVGMITPCSMRKQINADDCLLLEKTSDKDHVNSALCQSAMNINDSTEYDDEERESALADLFKLSGIEMVFTDEEEPNGEFRKRGDSAS